MKVVLGSFAAAAVLASTASAASLSYDINTVYTGGAPGGTAPWLRITFTDAAPGTVNVTLEALNLQVSGAQEFISTWWFNVDAPTASLAFYEVGRAGSFNPTPVVPSAGSHPGAAGYVFNVEVAFNRAGRDGLNGRFTDNDAVTINVASSAKALTINDFLKTSAGSGAPLFTGMHVQGLAGEPGSGHLTTGTPGTPGLVVTPVPETSTVLAGLALAGVAAGSLWRRSRK
jgi:hypothetical protein